MGNFARNTAVLALALGVMTGPALADDEIESHRNDPLESMNRFTSGLNAVLRKRIFDPVVDIYQFITPDPIEGAISNAASNLSEPVTAISSILQGDSENAGNAFQRFLVNSTVGIGGLGDPAAEMGIESRDEDLGQAFAANGVEAGPHLVLPILGPTNFRDAIGDIATSLANPLPLAGAAAAGAVEYSDNQDLINDIGNNSLDRYVAEREAYEQNRNYEISNGLMLLPDFEDTANR